jgi:outer membrane protein OmpA-like peptidoglycan-associated protein
VSAGQDPNETFANVGPRPPSRVRVLPLLLVAMVVLGCGFLIAWGLNQLMQKRRAAEIAASAEPKTTEPAAAVKDTLPPPPPASDVQVVTTQPTPPPAVSKPVEPELVPTSVAAGPVVQNIPSNDNAPRPTPPPGTVPAESTVAPVVAAEPVRPIEQPAPTPVSTPRAFAAMPNVPVASPPPPVIDTNLKNPENALIKQEVLKRIDLMPDLSPENREKLYDRVERTPGMGRVATIFFDTGDSRVRPTDVERLRYDLSSPAAQRLVDDPTVVFVVLGYADPTGTVDLNKVISQNRANNAVSAMRERLKLSNVMHAVAMGSSTLFGDGRGQLQKNRVVEVWAVMP